MAAATFLNNLLGKGTSRSSKVAAKPTTTTTTTGSRAFSDITNTVQHNQQQQHGLPAKKAELVADQTAAVRGLSRQTVKTSLVRPARGADAPQPRAAMPRQAESRSLARPPAAQAPRPLQQQHSTLCDDDDDGINIAAQAPARPQSVWQAPSALTDDAIDVFEAPSPRSAVRDIDCGDRDAPQFVSEYVAEIYGYLRTREAETRVNPRYMQSQIDITEAMRKLLVSWMIDVSMEFQLMSETTFLSVMIVDQFLQQRKVPRDRLQLLGIAAMLLASKYEEIYHPPVEDFLYICANAFDRQQLVKMELYVFQTLKFDLGFPTALSFLRRYSKAAGSDPTLHTCCKYFLELALPAYPMVAFAPSKVAAAAVYLTRKIFQKLPTWDETMQFHASYTEAELMPCVKTLMHVVRKEAALEAPSSISEKYATPEFMKISTQVLAFYRKRASRVASTSDRME